MGKPNARDRILEAASGLFHQHGYANVGINEIIETAETAKASFYQHFPSKEALCEAWLKDLHARSEEKRRKILESDQTAVEKIETYFQVLAEYLVKSDFRGCPYTNTCAMIGAGSAMVMDQIKVNKEAIRDFFTTIIRQASDDPETAARLGEQIFVLHSGGTTEAQNFREIWPVEAARDAAIVLCRNLPS